MADFDETDEPVMPSPSGRKKKRQADTYKRNVEKKARHSSTGKVPSIACLRTHRLCRAATISAEDTTYIHSVLYSTCNKVQQDAILLSYMDITQAKRRRSNNQVPLKTRDLSVKYSVLTQNKDTIPVCKQSFLSIFCVKEDRVTHIAKYWFQKGVTMPEKRGGARNTNERAAKRAVVRDHITTFTCRASHYARRGAPGRKYLPTDLNVKKMHDLFQRQNHEQTSYAFYYGVFMYDFNLGFGHPAMDVCSTCVKFRLRLNDPENTAVEKCKEYAMFLLHRRRGRKFYDMLNAVGETYTVAFDIMQNLVLPKSPIGQTYYSRQLYLYIFGVVRHRGRTQPQGKDDIHLFVWLENENKKDSNMVASALNYFLDTVARNDLSQHQNLRLFSDSCYGQNKNINVLSMLFALRKQKYKQMRIEYHFPIRGYSFLPPDRVFGRIEQELRKNETILLPSEYLVILRKHGNVHVYGEHWQCYDYKAAASSHCASARSFKISDARVLEINGDKLGFKPVYNGDFCYHSVLKRGKKWEKFRPAVAPMVNCVKEAKKADVLKLLNELGVSEPVRNYYDRALANVGDQHIGRQDLEESSDEEN